MNDKPTARSTSASKNAVSAMAKRPEKSTNEFPLERAASVSHSTLREVIERFADLRRNDVIYAIRPFGPTSRAVVVPMDSRLGLPQHIKDAGYTCFIRQPDAAEAFESLPSSLDTVDNRTRLLIHVVTQGRYPDWIR